MTQKICFMTYQGRIIPFMLLILEQKRKFSKKVYKAKHTPAYCRQIKNYYISAAGVATRSIFIILRPANCQAKLQSAAILMRCVLQGMGCICLSPMLTITLFL